MLVKGASVFEFSWSLTALAAQFMLYRTFLVIINHKKFRLSNVSVYKPIRGKWYMDLSTNAISDDRKQPSVLTYCKPFQMHFSVQLFSN